MYNFVKEKDNKIYLNNELVGNLVDVINIMIENSGKRYNFINFTKIEIKGIKLVIESYNNYLTNRYKKEHLTIATHVLKYKTKRYHSFKNSLSELFKNFQSINEIEFKRIANKNIIIVSGTLCIYGIKNEYGLYDIDNDEFITNKQLEENQNKLIEELNEEKIFHYVRKRVR